MSGVVKGLTFVLMPSGILILGVLLAAVWLWRRPSRSSLTAFAVFGGLLAIAAYSPAGFLAMSVLEHRFPAWRTSAAPVTGMVMLDGRIERLPYDLALARAYPQARVIFSGRPERDYDGFALLRADGLEPTRSVAEGRSKDTFENAVLSLKLAKPKPGDTWLLVTSAAHMPRAMAVFRSAGFPVKAAPVEFRTSAGPSWLHAYASDALMMCDEAFREFVGLIGYRLTGKTRELWPKP